MTTTPTPSPIGDSLREAQSTTIKALAEMVRLCMPDHLPDKVGDLEIIPRDPVMEQVTRIRGAWDKVSLYLAQNPQSVGAPVPDGWAFVPLILTPEMEAAGWPADTAQEGWERACRAAPTAPVSPALPYGWVEPETGNFAFHADVERCRKVRPNDYASWSVPVFAELRERNEGGGEAVAAWRGVNELGEVVTEWQDGAPPAILYDLCGNSPTYYASVQVAYTRPAPTASDTANGEPI